MGETDIDRCCANESLVAQRRVMDKNVILRLYAYPRGDQDANMTIQQGGTYWPPRRVTQLINHDDCRQGEQTLLNETSSASDAEQVYDDQPYFEFRFDTVRSHTEEFIFSTDQKCDVRLPDGLRLSSKHVCITFDDKRRLVVGDLGSTNGKSENPGCYSIACDLWSLGAVLSEILFGRPPWPRSRDTDRANCDAILTRTRQPCEADLQHLQRVLLQNLLVTDPEQRRTAADCYELAMALLPVDEP